VKTKQHRLFSCVLMCVLVLGWFGLEAETMGAEPKPIKIAVVYPMSGALARNGSLCVQGAKAAIKWVNDQGGIKSLGGAKLEAVVADTGSSVEGAASAMERVLRDPNISMAMGCWASSLTMSATEITERLGVPQFSISYSDELSARGFKYGFYVVAPSLAQGRLGLGEVIELARGKGQKIETAMLVGDNQGASTGFYAACRKLFPEMGIKIVGEEVWAMGTLTDASAVMQKVKSQKPDIVIFMATAISEAQICLMKKKELGLEIPFVCNGGWAADPSFRPVGAETLEGMITITPAFPAKETPPEWIKYSLEQCKKEYSDEPWVGQELGYAWTLVPIMAEVLEQAKSTDRNKIRETASKLDIHNVMATRYVPEQGMAFDETGRIAKKYQGVLLVQWQKGVPICVYPEKSALAKPTWVVR
jgi:branched-chain amino acid transport system substrate-binding protein